MKKKDRERQPKFRATSGSSTKTPLTFYRSSPNSKEEERSPFRKKELRNTDSKFKKFTLSFLNGILILSLLALLIYSLVIRPSAAVELNGEVFHSKAEYRMAVNKILSGIKNSNKITFSEKDVITKLQKDFPEIVSGRIELPILSQTPVIHLKIASPSFVLSSNGTSYIVDSEGVAVAKSMGFPSAEKLTVVEDQTGFVVEVGKQVMSADSVKFIDTVTKQSKKANVQVSNLILPSLAQELYLRTADRPYYVKFYLGGDALQEVGQFLATRHQFDTTNMQPVEYLDVRVAGKIFYR